MGGHGEECRAEQRRENRVGIFQHGFEGLAEGFGRLPAGLEHRDFPVVEHEVHSGKAARDFSKDGKDGENHSAAHEAGLDEVGPYDGLDAADGGVERGDGGDEDDAPEVGPERDLGSGEKVAPDDDEYHAAEVEADPDAEHAAEEEDPARHVFRAGAEAECEVFVDALDLELEIGGDEEVGDDDAGKDGADGELGVGEAEGFEAFGGSAEKCRGAGLGRDDRGEHGPPGDFVPAKRELLESVVFASGVEADADNDDAMVQMLATL